MSFSQKYYGLGDDDGSSIVLFGWRFTPTLIAVLYTQLTAMLFDDVKRTEPFVRMARNTSGEVGAAATILRASTAWWTALADGFSRKKDGGQRSGTLVCSAAINIIAFLTISPLLSSLLSTHEISVSEKTKFTSMVPVNHSQIALNPGRETCLHTTSDFLSNISTTDWITGSYAVLPFWPSIENPRLGQNILDTPGAWKADTIVFSADLSCTNMSLLAMTVTCQTFSLANYYCIGVSNDSITMRMCPVGPLFSPGQPAPLSTVGPLVSIADGYVPLISTIFASADRCKYSLEVPLNILYAHPSSGGFVTWTKMITIVNGDSSLFRWISWVTGNKTLPQPWPGNLIYTNYSDTCGGKEVFLLTTPWTSYLSRDKLLTAPNLTLSNNITFSCFLYS